MSSVVPELSPLIYNSSYNPGESLVYFTSIYGAATEVTFNEIQKLVNEKTRQAITFGVRFGAATLAMIIMWMVSKKKKTPIFIINQISLILILIHSSFYFKYFLSPISSITYSLTGFPQTVSRDDIHIYGAASMFQVLLVASIETSLVFQMKVMFISVDFKNLGLLVMAISSSLGLATIAMYFTAAIKGMISTYQGVDTDEAKYFNIASILLSTSTNFMTLVLVLKLLFAIRSRRFLGLKQFDSFHILLIMSCQSLLIPSILFILSYSLDANHGTDVLTSVATLLVVLSLPLSSLWATASNNISTSKPIESDFSPSDGGFYPNDGNNTFGAQSINSENNSYLKSKIQGFYPKYGSKYTCSTLTPMSGRTNIDEYKTGNNVDIEKNSFYDIAVNNTIHRTPFLNTDKGKSISRVMTKLSNPSLDIYTPNTLADEEARKFWINGTNDNESDNNLNSTSIEKTDSSSLSF